MRTLALCIALTPNMVLGQSSPHFRIGVAVFPVDSAWHWNSDAFAGRVAASVSRGLSHHSEVVVVDRSPEFLERLRDSVQTGRLVGARALVRLQTISFLNSHWVEVETLNVETGDSLYCTVVPVDPANLDASLKQTVDQLATAIIATWSKSPGKAHR